MIVQKTKSGFTLIELLVVISIIALLVSILLPALQTARRKAGSAVCLMNQKGIALAWIMYADDNADRLVGGDAPYKDEDILRSDEYLDEWVSFPQDEQGNQLFNQTQGWVVAGLEARKEAELWGIKHGKLFDYVGSIEAYHCPTDTREKKFGGFRTYSIGGGLNGEDHYYRTYKKSTIKKPYEKYICVEEPDTRGWNMGSWIMYSPNNLYTFGGARPVTDPVATWHGDGTVMNYVDGRAESHRWIDEETVTNAEKVQQGGEYVLWGSKLLGDDDYIWMKKRYAYNDKRYPQLEQK